MGGSLVFLAVTVCFVAALGAIAVRVYRRDRRDAAESPKYRMLEDD